jgi:hypothetical protein
MARRSARVRKWRFSAMLAQTGDGILRCADLAKTDHILLRMQWPGLEHHEALGSIERVGRIIATVG